MTKRTVSEAILNCESFDAPSTDNIASQAFEIYVEHIMPYQADRRFNYMMVLDVIRDNHPTFREFEIAALADHIIDIMK